MLPFRLAGTRWLVERGEHFILLVIIFVEFYWVVNRNCAVQDEVEKELRQELHGTVFINSPVHSVSRPP